MCHFKHTRGRSPPRCSAVTRRRLSTSEPAASEPSTSVTAASVTASVTAITASVTGIIIGSRSPEHVTQQSAGCHARPKASAAKARTDADADVRWTVRITWSIIVSSNCAVVGCIGAGLPQHEDDEEHDEDEDQTSSVGHLVAAVNAVIVVLSWLIILVGRGHVFEAVLQSAASTQHVGVIGGGVTLTIDVDAAELNGLVKLGLTFPLDVDAVGSDVDTLNNIWL